MNKKLLQTILIIAIPLLMLKLGAVFFVNIVMNDTILTRSTIDFQNSPKHINYLFMGDSHMMFGVNPKYISKKSHNLAVPAESYIESFYKLKWLLNTQDKQIDNLILELDNHSMSSFRDGKYKRAYYWKNYLDYLDIAIKTKAPNAIFYKFVSEIFPYFNQKVSIFNYIRHKPQFQGELTMGHFARKGDGEKRDLVELAKNRTDMFFKGFEPLNYNMELYFTNIISLAREHNIKVTIISLPVTKIYKDISNKYIMDKHFSTYKAKLLDELNLNYMDYSDLLHEGKYRQDLEYKYFSDSDHLNDLGATILSRKLKVDLKITE